MIIFSRHIIIVSLLLQENWLLRCIHIVGNILYNRIFVWPLLFERSAARTGNVYRKQTGQSRCGREEGGHSRLFQHATCVWNIPHRFQKRSEISSTKGYIDNGHCVHHLWTAAWYATIFFFSFIHFYQFIWEKRRICISVSSNLFALLFFQAKWICSICSQDSSSIGAKWNSVFSQHIRLWSI